MRLTILAFAMLPMAAQAQQTTLPAPTEPVGQSQLCPAGTAWDGAAQSCAPTEGAASQANSPAGHGCSYSAAREVTS